jgi:hypothetical protein
MMEALQLLKKLKKDGEVLITGLPYKKGQSVEIIVLPQSVEKEPRNRLTVGRFRKSGLIGLWKDRDDIGNSSVYARQLREKSQKRKDIRL